MSAGQIARSALAQCAGSISQLIRANHTGTIFSLVRSIQETNGPINEMCLSYSETSLYEWNRKYRFSHSGSQISMNRTDSIEMDSDFRCKIRRTIATLPTSLSMARSSRYTRETVSLRMLPFPVTELGSRELRWRITSR